METLIGDSGAVVAIKSVADCLACRVWQVGQRHVDVLVAIGGHDQHVAERVGEKVFHHVPLNVVETPALSCLSSLVDCAHKLIHVTLGIHGVPETLTIGRVVSPAESLLITVVEEGDASGREREGNSVLEARLGVPDRQETSIVVVIHEGAKDVNVDNSRVFELLVTRPETIHRLSTAIDISQREEHRVVEQGCQVVLVVTNVVRITVEGFSHLEDARCIAILFPEGLGHVRHRVDADTIEVESAHCLTDPVLEILAHKFVVLV